MPLIQCWIEAVTVDVVVLFLILRDYSTDVCYVLLVYTISLLIFCLGVLLFTESRISESPNVILKNCLFLTCVTSSKWGNLLEVPRQKPLCAFKATTDNYKGFTWWPHGKKLSPQQTWCTILMYHSLKGFTGKGCGPLAGHVLTHICTLSIGISILRSPNWKTLKSFFSTLESLLSTFPFLALLPSLCSHKTAGAFCTGLLQQWKDSPHLCWSVWPSPGAIPWKKMYQRRSQQFL